MLVAIKCSSFKWKMTALTLIKRSVVPPNVQNVYGKSGLTDSCLLARACAFPLLLPPARAIIMLQAMHRLSTSLAASPLQLPSSSSPPPHPHPHPPHSFILRSSSIPCPPSASITIAARQQPFLDRRLHGLLRIYASQEAVPPLQEAVQVAEDLFDEAQEKILSKFKENPDLRPVIAEKLMEITKELDHTSNGAAKLQEGGVLSPFETIKRGFLQFKTNKFLKNRDLWSKLAAGQSPKFMVIACSDSRVCPTEILGFQPGEAFVVRNIANMVPAWEKTRFPGTSAALEFAVRHVKVENILVMGHSRCAGIKALMSQQDDAAPWSDFIESWIQIGNPACARVKAANATTDLDDLCSHCEKESVNLSLTNLLTFPWIKEAVSNGNLTLHGGYYDFIEGSFEYWGLNGDVTKF